MNTGHEILTVTSAGRWTVPMPTYPESHPALLAGRGVRRDLDHFAPHCVHIATEGPLGVAARRCCRIDRLPFATAYQPQVPG